MAFFRQLVALIAVAIASSGSLPLVVHELTCHQVDASPSGIEKTSQCHCSRHCVSVGNKLSGPAVEARSDGDCVICFQLSQATHAAIGAPSVYSAALGAPAIVPAAHCDLPKVDCPHPPRGPPSI